MKKISAFVMLILMFSFISFADEVDRDIKIWVDENYIFSDVKPIIVNSRTQVPVRFIAEELGFDVKWLAETREVIITDGKINLKLKIDSDIAIKDGKEFKLDNKVFIKDSRTYLPLRFISESFLKKVDYNAETKTAIIGEDFDVNKYYPIRFYQDKYHYTIKEEVRFADNSFIYEDNNKAFESEAELLYYFKRPIAKIVLDKKEGLIDINGNMVLELTYDYIGNYDQGYFRFNKNEKMGMLDKLGDVVVEPKYDRIYDIEDNQIKVGLDDKEGIIDLKGNEIIEVKYDLIDYPRDGYYRFKKGKEFGYITEDKKEILLPEYDYLSSFCEGVSVFERDGKYGIMDKDFKEIVTGYDYMNEFYYNDITTYEKDGKKGIIDNKGHELTEAVYDSIHISNYIWGYKDLLMASKDGKSGLIDRNGNAISPFKYDFLIPISNDYIKFNIGGTYGHGEIYGGKWGILDKNGKELIVATYDEIGYDISPFGNISAKKNEKYGIINVSGKITVPFTYDRIQDYSDGLAIFEVKMNGYRNKYGAFDETGKIALKPEYNWIGGFNHGVSLFGVSKQLNTGEVITKFGIMDKNRKIIIEPKYDDVGDYNFSQDIRVIF